MRKLKRESIRKEESMSWQLSKIIKLVAMTVIAFVLFGGGYVAGQNRVGQPKTIIHVVEIKWNPGVSAAQKQAVLDGLKRVAMRTPGVKNIWTQADRL
ncbi:MAG TPA: hypothetical protein VFF11_15600, partial [Candidatus Binatia bacterium]|nr:hypothetical protein [Candidatus Binatia bacterium]